MRIVRLWNYLRNFEASKEISRALAADDEQPVSKRIDAALYEADALCGESKHAEAVDKAEGLLDTHGLAAKDKLKIHARIFGILLGQSRMQAAVDRLKQMQVIEPRHSETRTCLWKLVTRRGRWVYVTPEHRAFACAELFKTQNVPLPWRKRLYRDHIRALLQLRKPREAADAAAKAVSDAELPAMARFEAALIRHALGDAAGNGTIDGTFVASRATELALSNEDRFEGLKMAAKTLTAGTQYEPVRALLRMVGEANPQTPNNSTVCTYVDHAPLGAAGWLLSDIVRDESRRATGFTPYSSKDAALMYTDAAADRGVTKGGTVQPYIDSTTFFMVYDPAGWHIFVQCGEPNAETITLDNGNLGALETFFVPGTDDEPYYQWILRQTNNELSVYDWCSPNSRYRSLDGRMQAETVVHDGVIGTRFFIPWEAVYDVLPFDTGKDWLFSTIRWAPGGGVTWGGRVHERSRWGTITWQSPAPEALRTIRRNIARKAWAHYKNTSKKLAARWVDPELGDPAFYETALRPELDRLSTAGEAMAQLDALDADRFKVLYENTVPDWFEINFHVAELRRKYLAEHLFADAQ